jgi:dihydropteroate synthase
MNTPSPKISWQAGRFSLDLQQPRIMGIVNCTPDSFSDGGQFASSASAIAQCERLVREGADILDIGAESTRPGAAPLPLAEELARLEPVVKAAMPMGVAVSVDSYKAAVMQAALDWGVDIINDVWALRQEGAAAVLQAYPQAGVVLMHMHRQPQDMQMLPMQGDALAPVHDFFAERIAALAALQTAAQPPRLCLDVGIGFGKTVAQNFTLTRHLQHFADFGLPLLMGWSRKSSLGAITGLEVGERLAPSLAAAILSVQNGAQILRVHDVGQTRAALQVLQAVQGA